MDRAQRAELQQQLIRLADGDREAFLPAFVLLWPLLRRFAARHLGTADAEDVAQQALLKAFFHAVRFDRDRDALAWVLGIAAHEIQSIHRKRRRERPEDEDAAGNRRDGSPSPEDLAIATDLRLALEGTLVDLSPGDAETLACFAHDRRPAGVAAATFRKRLQRALGRLRQVWRQRHGPE